MDEELDLDALADLLDEEDLDFEAVGTDENIPANNKSDPIISTNEHSKIDGDKESSQKKIPELVSVDLFSKESNNSVIVVSSQTTKKVSRNNCAENDDDSDDEKNLTEAGLAIKKRIALRKSYEEKPQRRQIKTWKDNAPSSSGSKSKLNVPKEYMVEEYSGLRIVNPLIPYSIMKTKMQDRRMIKMSFLQNYVRNGDIEGDWVTIGVLANKLPPKTSKNGKTYSIWKMCDLHDVERIISVFLFGAVHIDHWKTAIGTVVGILNPSFFSNKDSNKSTDVCISVDHPGKFMMMGTSKDFGYCKGTRKDGLSCSSIINKSQCEFCTYHVSKEYKKLSSKRIELQASYSGREPVDLKKKVLSGQNVIYGGQLFSAPSRPASNSRISKDKLILNNLGLKRKAEALESEASLPAVKADLSKVHGVETKRDVASESKFINQQLSVPSAGSRNLFRHLVKANDAEIAKQAPKFVSITPKELLKMHESQLRTRPTSSQKTVQPSAENSPVPVKGRLSLNDLSPKLGRGVRPGDNICFDSKPNSSKKIFLQRDLDKLRAIRKVQENGPIKAKNPNAVKGLKDEKVSAKILQSVEKDTEVPNVAEETPPEKKSGVVQSMLGSIDLSSDKIQRILNKKSNHAFELEIEELDKQDRYFNALEKKEQMEEKMTSTMKIVCDVVSCEVCKYTAPHATERCKSQGHRLRCHKGVKRFFLCSYCKHRTAAFTKMPTRPCRNCGESKFERTSMIKARAGPKLDCEILNIRGDEAKFLDSMVH